MEVGRFRCWFAAVLVLVQCARLPPADPGAAGSPQPELQPEPPTDGASGPTAKAAPADPSTGSPELPLDALTLEDLRQDIAMVTCDAVPRELNFEPLPAHVWSRSEKLEEQCADWTAAECKLSPLHGKDWVLADHDYAAVRAPSGSWFGFSLMLTWMKTSGPEEGFASETEMDFAWKPFAEGVSVLEVYLTEHFEAWSADSDVVEVGTAVQIAWCFAGTRYIACTLEENLSSKSTSTRYRHIDAESGTWDSPVEGSETHDVMMDWKVAYPGDGTIRIDTESTPLLYCLQPQLPGDEDPRR